MRKSRTSGWGGWVDGWGRVGKGAKDEEGEQIYVLLFSFGVPDLCRHNGCVLMIVRDKFSLKYLPLLYFRLCDISSEAVSGME